MFLPYFDRWLFSNNLVTFICIKYTIFYEQALLDDSLFDKDTTAGMMLLRATTSLRFVALEQILNYI